MQVAVCPTDNGGLFPVRISKKRRTRAEPNDFILSIYEVAVQDQNISVAVKGLTNGQNTQIGQKLHVRRVQPPPDFCFVYEFLVIICIFILLSNMLLVDFEWSTLMILLGMCNIVIGASIVTIISHNIEITDYFNTHLVSDNHHIFFK